MGDGQPETVRSRQRARIMDKRQKNHFNIAFKTV